MKKWHIYEKEGFEIDVVKDGFNWWAFWFAGIWAIFRGLTTAGIIGIAVTVAANRMPPGADIIAFPILIGLMLLYGFQGNSWVCSKLEKNGYRLISTIDAASKSGAKSKHSELSPMNGSEG